MTRGEVRRVATECRSAEELGDWLATWRWFLPRPFGGDHLLDDGSPPLSDPYEEDVPISRLYGLVWLFSPNAQWPADTDHWYRAARLLIAAHEGRLPGILARVPVIVHPMNKGGYVLVDGCRRVYAAWIFQLPLVHAVTE